MLATPAELGLPGRPQPTPQTGPAWFAEQNADTQSRILGPAKFALFRDGKIDLADLVFEAVDPRWGISYREGSIAHALAVHGGVKAWQRYD